MHSYFGIPGFTAGSLTYFVTVEKFALILVVYLERS